MADGTNYRPKFGYDIRIRPPRADQEAAKATRVCEAAACAAPGLHRVPRSRSSENDYRWLCLDHAREFNSRWNYFAGMSADEVRAFQESAIVGHRPTWKLGSMGASSAGMRLNEGATRRRNWSHDPFIGVYTIDKGLAQERQLTRRQERAFFVFALEHGATREDIRRQFKLLVNRFHPDANGGDKASEDRLREVIEAYQVLKSGGFC